jgi:hypothetical protein
MTSRDPTRAEPGSPMLAPKPEFLGFGQVSGSGYQRLAFLFETVGITMQHYRIHADDGDELGVRIEIQHLDADPGPDESDAWELRLHDPIFRVDLFTLSTGVPGNLDRAHYHPVFSGRYPGERVFDVRIQTEPLTWLTDVLSDLDALLATAGCANLAGRGDGARVAAAVPAIIEAARQFLSAAIPELATTDWPA